MKTMSKWVFQFGLVISVFTLATNLYAAPDAAKEREKQAKLIAEKKEELNNHEWEIDLKSAGSKGEPQTDVLAFKGMKFETKKMSAAGYAPTNYTITLQENGPTVWETMQTSPKGHPVFWRGEWKNETMTGVMNKQLDDNKNEEFYFKSSSSRKVEEEKPVEPAPVPAEVVDGAAAVPEVSDIPAVPMPEAITSEAAVAEVKSETIAVKAEAPKITPEVKEAKKKDKHKRKWGF